MLKQLGHSSLPTLLANVAPLVFLYKDNLTGTDDNPMTSPHAADVLGTMTLVQADGTMAIASQEWTWTAQSTPVFGDQRAVEDVVRAHAGGRTIYFTINFSNKGGNGVGFGWSDKPNPTSPSSDLLAGLQVGSSNYVYDNKVLTDLTAGIIATATDYRVYVIRRASGGMFLVIGGNLEWVGAASIADAYMAWSNNNAAFKIKDHVAIWDMTTMFTTRWGDATAYSAAPVTGDTITHTANGMLELSYTATAGDTVDIQVRRTDDSNCWIVRIDKNGNRIYLYEKTAGVEVERGATGGIAQTWTTNTVYRIVVKFFGNIIHTFVAGTAKHAYNSASFQNTAVQGKVSGFTAAKVADLATWPRSVSPQYPFDVTYYLGFGDSKTAMGIYQPYLSTNLNVATSTKWAEIAPGAVAVSGYTIGDLRNEIDARLAAIPASAGTPAYILCNVGANDVNTTLPTQGDWTTRYLYNADAMHAKYPNALMYIAKPWRAGKETNCNTIAGWIDAMIPQRNFLRNGIDERAVTDGGAAVLEGGDNGATRTSDGIHPNAAGAVATAAAWQGKMGY